MKSKSVFLLLIVSLIVSAGGQLASITLNQAKQDRVTGEICSMVGNSLEVGALRDAYEGLKVGLTKSGLQNSCVSVLDNGRSFSPDCLLPQASYRTVVCKAEGNIGVRAQVSHPIAPFFSISLLAAFALIFAVGISLTLAARSVVSSLASRMSSELQRRLIPGSAETISPNFVARTTGFILEFTGLAEVAHREIVDLHAKVAIAEASAIHEAALRAKHEAESAKSKDYIEKVRQIRHDIRSPLSALFAAKSAISSDELLQNTLSSSIRGIEKMIDDLHRLEEAEAEPRLTIVEVVLEEEASGLRPRFRSGKRANLFLVYDTSSLSPVMVVPDSFRRVVRNLLENAYDALSREGEIRITVARLEGFCLISIEDDGCGVPPEAIRQLFNRGATFSKVGGTGLGLYSAREALRGWRGEIEFTPLRRGSRFAVTLPLAQVGVGFVGLPESSRLWVIDDKPQVADQLRRAGFEIERTAVGRDDGRRLLDDSRSSDAFVLLDQNLENGVLGTDLAAEGLIGGNVYLCTDAYDDQRTLGLARQRSLSVLPKPLCYLASPGL